MTRNLIAALLIAGLSAESALGVGAGAGVGAGVATGPAGGRTSTKTTTGRVAGGSSGNGKGASYGALGFAIDSSADPGAGFVPFNYHGSSGYPIAGVWGGFGGSAPVVGGSLARGAARPRTTRAVPPAPVSLVSNEFPATLRVQLPVNGLVSANGSVAESTPRAEWTLQSPNLKPGQEFTFNVTAQWEEGGKTFEYRRSVVVSGGDRSQVRVVSGTEMESGSLSRK